MDKKDFKKPEEANRNQHSERQQQKRPMSKDASKNSRSPQSADYKGEKREAGERSNRNRSNSNRNNRNISNRNRNSSNRNNRELNNIEIDYIKLDYRENATEERDFPEYEDRRTRQDPWGRESARRSSRVNAGKRRSSGIGFIIGLVFFIFAFVAIGAAGYILWERMPTNNDSVVLENMANLNNYFGTGSAEDLAVIINTIVVRGEDTGTGGRIFDGEVYLDLSIVNRELFGRFYWSNVEQHLIHTLPYGSIVVSADTREYTDHGESRSENFDIIRIDRGSPFIALAFVQRFANIEYELFEEPNRLVVTTRWGDRSVTDITSNTVLRTLAGPEAPILREIERGEEVFYIEDEGYWRKIATLDGFTGYVLGTEISDIRQETFSRDFEEPVFTQIVREGPINVGWDNTNTIYDNAYVQETINRSVGLTAIAPMWLSIADVNGNIDSIATLEYVQAAHNAGIEVWVTLRDFHGGISSYNETYEVLSRTSSRRQIIDQTIAETLRVGADGINLDLELVPFEAGAHFVQFVREMSVDARINGLVLSVANFYPLEWRLFMNLSEQARVVDYIMLMGYDEHYEGGRRAGPVASFEFVRNGIESSLRQVPADMLINAIPFYARLWYEVPMTDEEIAVGDGYTTHVSSVAFGMEMSMAVMLNSGVEMTWDPVARMYYAQWEDPYGTFRAWLEGMGAHTGALLPPSGGTYRMWLEDERSLREKLQIMRDFNLAGVASWRLGLESVGVWELIGEFF
jgi:spore germination protein YaaH